MKLNRIYCALGLFIMFFHAVPSTGAEANQPLTDIKGHWAKGEIEQAVAEGWVDGYPDGTFRPDRHVTRAELVKMMTRANHIYFGEGSTIQEFITKPETPSHFKRIENHWVWKQGFLQPAISWGLVVPSDYGVAGGFQPDHNASRREVSVMAVRAMGEVHEAQNINVNLPYKDVASIPVWLRGYVNVVSDAGVVEGYPNGEFVEKRLATRAETVAILLRQLNYNRQGIADDIKLEVSGGRQDQAATARTPKVPIQVVDNTIYVPVRDMFFDIKDWTRAPHWRPIEQTLYFDYDVQFGYTAGRSDFHFYGSIYGQLLQPVRVLNGELMLPVYHFEKGRLEPGIFYFDATWDDEQRTITVKPLNVPAPIS